MADGKQKVREVNADSEWWVCEKRKVRGKKYNPKIYSPFTIDHSRSERTSE